MYWHIGSRRNANATVAMTVKIIENTLWLKKNKVANVWLMSRLKGKIECFAYLLCKRRKAFASNRKRKTSQGGTLMHRVEDKVHASYLMLQIYLK